MIQGINIYTKSSDLLGRQLTNPSYAKNNKSDFDINPIGDWNHPKEFTLPNIKLFQWARNKYGENATAQNAWGKSVEAWYFANTCGRPYLSAKKKEIMEKLIICKFETYSFLIDEIDKRGGIEFLKRCSHIVSGNKNWEGEGLKSNFIRVLCNAYCNIKNLPRIDLTPPPRKFIMTILQEKLKELEILKELSEKYPDLELTKYGRLISHSSLKNCNLFKIDKICCGLYLKIYFIENEREVLFHDLLDISYMNADQLVKSLRSYEINEKLITDILINFTNINKRSY